MVVKRLSKQHRSDKHERLGQYSDAGPTQPILVQFLMFRGLGGGGMDKHPGMRSCAACLGSRRLQVRAQVYC